MLLTPRLLLIKEVANLSQTQVNSNYVLNFHSDACNMDADMADLSLFLCVLGIQS